MASRNNSQGRVVFLVRRDTSCDHCGEELWSGSMIVLEDDSSRCLKCAGLDELGFLPRGDAALTHRAKRYSQQTAVVVQWSRARKRYERQGILAEPGAIEQAEVQCQADQTERDKQRGPRRARQADRTHVANFVQ